MSKKTLLVSLSIILFLAFASIYIVIPRDIQRYQRVEVYTTPDNCSVFLNPSHWKKWIGSIRDSLGADSSTYSFGDGNLQYKVSRTSYADIGVLIEKGDFSLTSRIDFSLQEKHVVKVGWDYSVKTSANPLKRIQQYFYLKVVDKQIDGILQRFKAFMQYEPNIYGFDIFPSKIQDSILIATKSELRHYPETSFIYKKISLLKEFISASDLKQTGHPMINITPLKDSSYTVTIAVPIDGPVEAKGDFFVKRMIMGNFLETTAQGGPHTVERALLQMQNYIQDHGMTVPAIPFESLVTDRFLEKDSTKWITKVYYPIL